MFKSTILFSLIILVSASYVFSQGSRGSKIPNLRLSLSAKEPLWETGKKAVVKIAVENLSDEIITFPDSIYFRITDGTRSEAITTRERVFWSPARLTKTYEENKNGCEDDLGKELDTTIGFPPPQNFILQKGEKKEFNFNLAGTCWNHVLSSTYPNKDLFALAVLGKYKVYFEIGFNVETYETNGMEIPLSKSIKSNEIEIIINRLRFGENK